MRKIITECTHKLEGRKREDWKGSEGYQNTAQPRQITSEENIHLLEIFMKLNNGQRNLKKHLEDLMQNLNSKAGNSKSGQ